MPVPSFEVFELTCHHRTDNCEEPPMEYMISRLSKHTHSECRNAQPDTENTGRDITAMIVSMAAMPPYTNWRRSPVALS